MITAKNQQGLVIDKTEILTHKTLKQKMLWEGVVKHLDTPPWTVLMAPGESAKPSDPVVGPTGTIIESVRLENTLWSLSPIINFTLPSSPLNLVPKCTRSTQFLCLCRVFNLNTQNCWMKLGAYLSLLPITFLQVFSLSSLSLLTQNTPAGTKQLCLPG